jgi:choline-sulfatase
MRANSRISQPVSLVDLLPTLADIGGATVPTPMAGRSWLPLLRGDDEQRAPVISEYLGEGAIEPMRMLRQGDHKYMIVNGYAPQLYDMKKDPEETVNLAGHADYKSIEHRLNAQIQAGWDGPALKKAVIADQQQRLFLFALMKESKRPQWDFASSSQGPYFR